MFKDKVVLITGGSSGIGKATALMFADQGAHLVITYKNNKIGAEDTASEIRTKGQRVLIIQADLGQEIDAKRVVQSTIAEYGKIDVLINNAGGYIKGDEWDGPSEIWMDSLRQNLVSVMNVSKYVLPIFQKHNAGVMVNISSRNGINGHSDAISYSASKAGVINITGAYAETMKTFGRANSICPSATNAGYWLTAPKEEIEMKLANKKGHKFIEPETIARKIIFLASDEAKDITGQNFPITE